jgi:hypothetical protein
VAHMPNYEHIMNKIERALKDIWKKNLEINIWANKWQWFLDNKLNSEICNRFKSGASYIMHKILKIEVFSFHV